jgi:hypothetical protein
MDLILHKGPLPKMIPGTPESNQYIRVGPPVNLPHYCQAWAEY